MSDCGSVREELGGYVLGGLDPSEVDAVARHLEGCGRCRQELDRLRPLPDLLDLAREAPPRAPRDLRDPVLRTRRDRRRLPVVVAAALAGLSAVAGLVVGFVVSDRGEGIAPPDEVVLLADETPLLAGGEAALREDPAGVRIDLEVEGVRPSEEGYYHVWLARGEGDEARASAGTFVGTDDGQVRVRLACGGRLEEYHRFVITWHPTDGEGPTVASDVAFAPPPAEGEGEGPAW